MGDTILALPVVEALRYYYPSAELYFLTSPIGAPILVQHPLIKKVFVVNVSSQFREAEMLILERELAQERFDIYISLWDHPLMAKLGKRLSIPMRIGDKTNIAHRFYYTERVRQRWEDLTRHQVLFNLDLLKALSIYNPPVIKKLYVSDEAVSRIRSRVLKHLDPNIPMITIFCGTGGTNYPVPMEAVRGFVSKMRANQLFNIVLAGPDSDDPFSEEGIDGVLDLTGKTTFEELMALIQVSDFYIGGDTGPTHVASFMNKPILFFSPQKQNPPTRWGPLSDYFRILRKDYMYPEENMSLTPSPNMVSFLDGELLYHSFCRLYDEVTVKQVKDFEAQCMTHRLHTFRVLYLYKNEKDYEQLKPILGALRQKGLVVFSMYLEKGWLRSYFKIMRVVRSRNINVIQADSIPFWMSLWVRLTVGVVDKYHPPVCLNYPLHAYVTAKELMTMYANLCQNKPLLNHV